MSAEQSTRVVRVASSEDLRLALEAATTQTIIELEGGDYGQLHLTQPYGDPWAAFEQRVTLRAATPDELVSFSGVLLRGVTNLSFENITFKTPDQHGLTPSQIDRLMAVEIRESHGIHFDDVHFTGQLMAEGDDSRSGLPSGFGLSARNSSDISVEDSSFDTLARGAIFSNADDLSITNNEITSIRSDGMDFAQVTNVTIEGNHFHDFLSSNATSDHRDMIQFWTRGTETASENVVIRNNIFDSGSGIETQTIFMRNELVDSYGASEDMFYQNILIEGNFIHNTHTHGITVGASNGLRILNNTLLANVEVEAAEGGNQPAIRVYDSSTEVLIDKNIVNNVYGKTADGASWAGDNLLTDWKDESAATYIGSVLNNPFAGGASTVRDWMPIAGSQGALLGYGAADKVSNEEMSPYTRVISDADEIHADIFTFSAESLMADTAAYFWDFGDGSAASGSHVTHEYTTPGRYFVTLNAADDQGATHTSGTWVYVAGTTRLSLKAEAEGVMDQSHSGAMHDIETVLWDDEHVIRVQDQAGFSLNRDLTPDIFGLSAFGLSVSLTALDGQNSAGEVLRIHTSMNLSIADDGAVRFNFTNDAGETVVLNSGPTHLLDGQKHLLSIGYDIQNARLVASVDGIEVAAISATGFTKQEEFWGMTIGAAYGKVGFDGLIHDVSLVSDPAHATQSSVVLSQDDDQFAFEKSQAFQTDGMPTEGNDTELNGVETMLNLLEGTRDADSITGSLNADKIIGHAGRDKLYGGAGNDSLEGKKGHDRLFGQAGDDYLIGHDGRDVLQGNRGNDTLIGGRKADVLRGGDGADTFVFKTNPKSWGKDLIKDFEIGVDRILIEGFTKEDVVLTQKDALNGVLAVIEGGGKIVFEGHDVADLTSMTDWEFI